MTLRIRVVIRGPSSGGWGPANASRDQIIGEVIIDSSRIGWLPPVNWVA